MRMQVRLILAGLLLIVWSASAFAMDGATLYVSGKAHVGEVFLARFVSSDPVDEVTLRWMGHEVPLRVEKRKGRYEAVALLGSDVKHDKSGEQALAVSARVDGARTVLRRNVSLYEKDYPVQRLKLPKKMVTPPQQTLDRIRKEREDVMAALATVTPEQFWSFPFQRPVPGAVSSVYGLKRLLNGKPRSPHRGIDFRGAKGTPVKAVNAGRVLLVGDHYFAGKSVYVDHGMGVISEYFHLSEIDVREGQMVGKGEVIGKIGKTGRVTGPHLHFGLAVLRQNVDPMPLFAQEFASKE